MRNDMHKLISKTLNRIEEQIYEGKTKIEGRYREATIPKSEWPEDMLISEDVYGERNSFQKFKEIIEQIGYPVQAHIDSQFDRYICYEYAINL